jgi:hypothetical protein
MQKLSASSGLPYLAALGAAIITGAALAPAASAQMAPEVQADPNMPTKDGFDTGRAIFWAHPNFQPLQNPEWEPMRDAVRRGDIEDETTVLKFEAGGKTLVLVSSQMSYHHVAQGVMEGEPWMVTF